MSSRLIPRLKVLALAARNRLTMLGRRKPPVSPRRILVAHHLLLGDTLMLTPLLAKLRVRYPNAKIVIATPKAIVPLYQHRPYGVISIPYDPRDGSTLKMLLNAGGFDLAIVPGDNRYSWLALAAGARWIVAFSGDRPAYKSWPVDRLVPYPSQPAAWGDMVSGLIDGSAPAPYKPEDWPAPDSRPFTLPQQPYCVLHVGASTVLRLWSPEKWRALTEFLTKCGLQIVWSGGPGEQRFVDEIDPDKKHLSFADQLDLAQLWQLLAHARLLVCPDTGVAHLGRIVGTPTVTLFGPGSPVLFGAGEFWRNSLYRAVMVDDFPCRDQRVLFRRTIGWVRRCSRGPRECLSVGACMDGIQVADVRRAIEELGIHE
ncbi:heptosyltransferase [Sulfuricella sp. T08]|uniref:glycosyltransferase family 9 protein n=1 Tax=Sulfuricella sp. T08 TaxID=1632857 RepID=UPI0006179FC9|nr:glycosyltransferase family 9 protein [Sulfuricella sp. T08]GAO34771.1 heptosyltransferase [Sulfuricella sp. T08]